MSDKEDKEVIQDLNSLLSQLKTERAKYEDTWDEITEILLPNMKKYQGAGEDNDEGEKYGADIYDNVGPNALDTCTNGFVGYMVSRATPWFKVKLANKKLEENQKVKKFLQDTEKAIYTELENSNFYKVLPRLFRTGCGIGSAYASLEEDYQEGRSVILSYHFRSIYVIYDKYENLIGVFRVFEKTLKEICDDWPDGVEEKIEKEKEKSPYEKRTVVHAVVVNQEWDPEKQATDKKRFKSYYYLESENTLLSEGGFDKMPYIGWLWRKDEGETYGTGKGHDALVMLRRSNLIGKTLDEAAELAVNPPIQYHEDVEDVIDITPHGMNPYEDPEKLIKPLELGKNYPIGRDREELYNQTIKETFYVDFFVALRDKSKQMTAREVNELQGEKAAIMGTDVGSIENGLLDKIIEMVYHNGYEQGRMPPAPQELLQGESELQLDYIGPLAQAQKRYHQTQGLKLGLEDILPLAQYEPGVLDNIDFDAVVRVFSENDGMPAETIKDPKLRDKIRAARAQAQQQQMLQQNMQQGADLVDKLNQPKEEGSMLDEVNKQLAAAIPGNQVAQ